MQYTYWPISQEVKAIRQQNFAYNLRNIFLEKSYTKCDGEIIPRPGTNSSIKPILTGVPRGSILGPLFFLLYINDLCNCVKYSETHHFADDTNKLQSHSSLKTLVKRVNLDIKNLFQWLKANKSSLIVTKTELIIFKFQKDWSLLQI